MPKKTKQQTDAALPGPFTEIEDVGKLRMQVKTVAAKEVIVANDTQLARADEERAFLARAKKEHPAIAQMTKIKESLFANYKASRDFLKRWFIDPIDSAIEARDEAILAYRRRKREEAAVASQNIQETFVEDQEAERKRAIKEALAKGDFPLAKKLKAMEITAPPVKVEEPPALQSSDTRKRWVAVITDPEKLLREILAGKAPIDEAIEFRMPYFNTLAREAQREDLGIAGVKGEEKESLAKKRGK